MYTYIYVQEIKSNDYHNTYDYTEKSLLLCTL